MLVIAGLFLLLSFISRQFSDILHGKENNNTITDYIDDNSNSNVVSTDNSTNSNVDFPDNISNQYVYKYPDNPVTELRDFFENDIIERGLPLKIGNVERVDWNGQERMEFMLNFTNDSENACVISFALKSSDYDYSLNGRDNPSFTIAFKDPYKSHDMTMVLTSVLLYLSPDLDVKEAEQLAVSKMIRFQLMVTLYPKI